jgi:SAM-dependent methyltransferase
MTDYRGIPIHAAHGVHEAAFALLRQHLPRGRVLDLGTGAGAFLQRLLDSGYDAEGVDIATSQVKAQGTVLSADLNTGLPDNLGFYDAICAIELIEHLENPRYFFRLVCAHLARDGILLVTTPNIDSIASRARFLVRGRYQWFEDEDYRISGHITPLAHWQILQIANECGLILRATAVGPPPIMGPRLALLAALMRPLMRGASRDDVRLYLFATLPAGLPGVPRRGPASSAATSPGC